MKTKLNEIAEISMGAAINRYSKKYDNDTQETDVLYCTVDEFYTRKEEISKEVLSKYLTKKGDVIFKLSSPQTAINIDENGEIPEGVLISSKFVIIKSKGVNPVFLAELLNSDIARFQMQKFTEGIIKQIKKSDLENLEFNIPSLEKQLEYVEYLNLINKEIKLQKQLIKENTDLKEGIIQKSLRVE